MKEEKKKMSDKLFYQVLVLLFAIGSIIAMSLQFWFPMGIFLVVSFLTIPIYHEGPLIHK